MFMTAPFVGKISPFTRHLARCLTSGHSRQAGRGLLLVAVLTGLLSSVTGVAHANGTSWTSQSTPSGNNEWWAVTYGNRMFVAVSGVGGSGNRVMTSPDGVTWTSRSSVANNIWLGVTYGGPVGSELFVAVSAQGTSSDSVMTSPDGVNWTPRTSPANAWRSVAWSSTAGVFVAVADTGVSRVMTSPDGINWTPRTPTSPLNGNLWLSVVWAGNQFVAVGTTGVNRVMTSPDGINWTARVAASAQPWLSVAYGDGKLVAVTDTGGLVMTSDDGINWTARTAPAVQSWFSVTYGGGTFVAVSRDGTNRVMTSTNGGTTWTLASAATPTQWSAVTYAQGRFVAVATSGTLNRAMTSGVFSAVTPGTPSPPTNVPSATNDGTSATITWTAPYSNGGSTITGYTVTSSPAGRTCTWTSGPLTCTITGLTPNMSYTFTVAATNVVGTGTSTLPSGTIIPPEPAPVFTEFTFLRPDGLECTSISPMRVRVGAMVELPNADADCRTRAGSNVAGWTIPMQPGETAYGSAANPFPPGLSVLVVDGQQFTLVPWEPIISLGYDANVALNDSCTSVANVIANEAQRRRVTEVARTSIAVERIASSAPCTPTGHRLSGWNTRGDGTGRTFALDSPLPTIWMQERDSVRTFFAVWKAN